MPTWMIIILIFFKNVFAFLLFLIAGYTLGKPGYTKGIKGPTNIFMKDQKLQGDEINVTARIINSTHLECELPHVVTAGMVRNYI